MRRFSAIVAAAALGIAGYGAEQPEGFAKAQAELKARAPEDYAKIEKLAATDLSAALREFHAAAQKHDIKIPRPNFQRNRRPPMGGDRPDRGGRPDWGGRQRRGDRPRRGGINPMMTLVVDGKVRKAFPQEFDAISRELSEAEEKLRKLAERAGVQYPQDVSSAIRKLRAAAPEKMAEIEQLAAEDYLGAFRALNELAREQGVELGFSMMRGRRGDRPRRGGGGEEIEPPEPRRIANPPLRKLREEFPAEMEKYEKLRQEDPAAAKKLLLELNERLNQRRKGK